MHHLSGSPQHGNGGPRWSAYVRYLRRSVALDSGVALPPANARTAWVPLTLQREVLITGRRNHLPITGEVRDLLTQPRQRQVLAYGWPLVVVLDGTSRARVGALFIAELEVDEAHSRLLPSSDQPSLNPSLVGMDYFDAPAVDAAREVAAALVFTSAETVTTGVRQVLTELRLDCDTLDPDALGRDSPLRPGVHNRAGVFLSEGSLMTRSLLDELEALERRSDWTDTAAAALVGSSPDTLPAAICEPLGSSAGPLPLTESQEAAVALSRSDRIVVVTGPPGTGKSQFLSGVVANAWLDHRSVLVASTNNAAVDVATTRCQMVHPQMLVRTGNKEHKDRLREEAQIAPTDTGTHIAEAAARLLLDQAAAAREARLRAIEERGSLDADLHALVVRMRQAAERVWGDPLARPPAGVDVSKLRRRARRVSRARLAPELRRRRLLKTVSALDPADPAEILAWSASDLEAVDAKRRRSTLPDPSSDSEALHNLDLQWQHASAAAVGARIQNPKKGTPDPRGELRLAGTGDEWVRALKRAQRTWSGWSCTALSVGSNFPLEAGSWDLVVVDEASQCSIAHLLPLAYRAKALVIVGDPRQLKPISQHSKVTNDLVAKAEGLNPDVLRAGALDYVGSSAYLLAEATVGEDHAHALTEHFRSYPTIARWFNQCFYRGRLHVLTSPKACEGIEPGMDWCVVRGDSQRTGSSHVNTGEADAIVKWVQDHVNESASIGVVTPFAAQAKQISERLRAAFDREFLASTGLECATAHRFQGGEKDVILFSAVIGRSTPSRTVQWVEKERELINVAVSRARCSFVGFGNPDVFRERRVPTLVSLHDACVETPVEPDESQLHSEAERVLYQALVRRGIASTPKLIVGGYELDFALVGPTTRLNVEVDGSQHLDERGRQRRTDLLRDRNIESLGWRVLRIPDWQCLLEPETAVDIIADALSAPT